MREVISSRASSGRKRRARQTMDTKTMSRITFGMQCFWGAEAFFGSIVGVHRTRVGYAGGTSPASPTYRNLGDHVEVVQMDFDPAVVTLKELVRRFLAGHDPTVRYKRQYISAIYPDDANDADVVAEVLREHSKHPTIVTEVRPLSGTFTAAEDYHQKYFLRKHPDIIQEMGLTDNRSLLNSTAATKLNSSCAGFPGYEQLADQDKARLSPKSLQKLQKLIADGPNLAECGI